MFRPYSRQSLPHFSALSEQERATVLTDMMNFYTLCLDVKETGHSLKDTRFVTGKAIQRLGLEIEEQYLNLIENQHVVEIYNEQQTQIFRSFRFFEVSSYTLEDLLCRRWYHIYDRPEEANVIFHEIVIKFYSQPKKSALFVDLPEVPIRERDTLENLTIHSKVEWFIPLFKDNEFKAVMLLIQAHN